MNHLSWLAQLKKHRAIAVIRTSDFNLGISLAQAVAEGGISLIEITGNSVQPFELVSQLREVLPQCVIGMGTILTVEQLQEAVNCGAQFCFTPHVNLTLIEKAIACQLPIIPGALSPTEIMTAWQAGASCVKVFPVQAMGGASYLKSLQGPLGKIPLIPTGGVTLENAPLLLNAGAIAVGLSSALFLPSLVNEQDWQGITQRAKKLRLTVL